MVLSSRYLDGGTLSWIAAKEHGVKCADTSELVRLKKAQRMTSFDRLDLYLSLTSMLTTTLDSSSSCRNDARLVLVQTSDYPSGANQQLIKLQPPAESLYIIGNHGVGLYLQEYNDLEDIGIGDPLAVKFIQAENVHFDRMKYAGAAMAFLKDRASATISSTAKGEGRRQQ